MRIRYYYERPSYTQFTARPWPGAIHFSTLAGRVLIKDLRYHSSNQTFRIVKVQLSWRYWLRQPAEEEDLSHARVIGEDTGGKGNRPLACRVHISLEGLEWFMYNRTAAFDNIVSQLGPDVPATPTATPVPDGAASVRKIFSRTSVFNDCMHSSYSLFMIQEAHHSL